MTEMQKNTTTYNQGKMKLFTQLQGGIFLTDEDIKQLLLQIRKGGGADHRFDINLVEGEDSENLLYSLIKGEGKGTIEVKRDYNGGRTNNIVIEQTCNGKPSGISTTEAEWWAYHLDGVNHNGDIFIIVKTDRLRDRMRRFARNSITRDSQKCDIAILPIAKLFGGI